MKILDKLILKDMAGPFVNGLFMFMTLLFAAAYLFPATDLLVHGVALGTVVKLVILSLPSVVTQTFPMAMLLGSLLAFGRISTDKELVAIFAAGIPFPRIVRSVWILGILVSVVAFFWNDMVVPPATTQYWDIRMEALKNILPSDRYVLHTIERPDGKGVEELISVDGGFNTKEKTLKRVTITRFSDAPSRKGQIDVIVYCERATPYDNKGMKWKYYNGYFLVFAPNAETGEYVDMIRTDFKECETLPNKASIPLTFEEALYVGSNDPNRLSFSQLRGEIVKGQARGADTRGMEVDLYGKLSLPLASLIFGIVGAALGKSTSRGGGKAMGFGMAIFIAFLYWVGYHSMFVVGKNGGLPPLVASFMADIIAVIAAVILVIRASR